MRAMDAFILFPLLVLSVAASGFTWSRLVEGAGGAADLWQRMRRWRVGARWYFAALLIPPSAILGVLGILSTFSGSFTPGFFGWGVLFGLFPGIFEEIGWTGYLLPQLLRRHTALASAVLLGVMWGCWHLPVMNFLGAAGPHGAAMWPFFLAFIAALTALRVLMTWLYVHTESVVPLQLMHASSTGSLVLFSPPHISAAREAFWYGCYAVALGAAVAVVLCFFGKQLRRSPARVEAATGTINI